MAFYFAQFLTGLASASSLFLIAAGLSVIFGVTRIVNFAHGSFYMLGAYLAYSLMTRLPQGPLGFWGGVVLAALVVGLIGAAVEMLVLRRVYRSPELFQLVATFGVVLVVQDATLYLWGPEDIVGPRAPGLDGAVRIFGEYVPEYDLALIAIGPLVLLAVTLLFRHTRFGILVRAATEDRDMVAALGVDQRWLFTAVFFLGSTLAGLGGALQVPRESISLLMDVNIIAEAFVVTVVGGMGSVPGAFLAAVLISELNAFGILVLPEVSLVLAFLVMAVVLVLRPWGLLGRPEEQSAAHFAPTYRPLTARGRAAALALLLLLLLLPLFASRFTLVLLTDVFVFALFAASLHFIMGPGGMVSFGHAAYFGLGAYAAALAARDLGAPMELMLALSPFAAAAAALVFGWFCVRLSGVYLAMLTLAAAQLVWAAVYQWDSFTGGDDGILGVWPSPWAADKRSYYYLALALCGLAIAALRWAAFTPFGYGLRGARDSALRMAAIGLYAKRFQWAGFVLAGFFAGIAGAVFVYAKGSVFPDELAIPRSIDALVMVLLGGIESLTGPLVGAFTYTLLEDWISRLPYWRFILGLVILTIVILLPEGIVGGVARLWRRLQPREAVA